MELNYLQSCTVKSNIWNEVVQSIFSYYKAPEHIATKNHYTALK